MPLELNAPLIGSSPNDLGLDWTIGSLRVGTIEAGVDRISGPLGPLVCGDAVVVVEEEVSVEGAVGAWSAAGPTLSESGVAAATGAGPGVLAATGLAKDAEAAANKASPAWPTLPRVYGAPLPPKLKVLPAGAAKFSALP